MRCSIITSRSLIWRGREALVRNTHNSFGTSNWALTIRRMQTSVSTPHAPTPLGPYSQAVKANGFLFISGQLGLKPETSELATGGVKQQTEQCLQNILRILEAAGCTPQDVVKTTVLLADIGDSGCVNEVYHHFFKKSGGVYPSRASYAVKELPKQALVEIEAVAALKRPKE